MPAKPKKHPRDMTTEEAIKHLFPAKVVKHIKKVAAESSTKRVTKKTI